MINSFVKQFCNPEISGQYDESILYEAVDKLLAMSRKFSKTTIKGNITMVGIRETTHALAIQALSLFR